MNTPLVSIIIPTYKRSNILSRTIDSVLKQTYKNIEVIVVDDNNPNTEFRLATELLMSKYQDKRLKYIKHEVNKNGSAARNTGIRNSSGEYVMFLDDDDEFLPNKVESQLNYLLQLDESWGACYTKYIRKRGNTLISKCTENREGNLLKEELMRNLWIGAGSNLMVRRKVIDEVGGFDESFKRNQDIEFLIRILKKYKLGHVDIFGLIINIEDEPHIKKEINVEMLTIQFIQTFKKDIDLLPIKDQKEVYEMLNLQIFRYFIFNKKDFIKAFKMVSTRKISFKNSIFYLYYLLDRKIKKESRAYRLL